MTIDENQKNIFSADRPLIDSTDDHFGFSIVAKPLAASVVSAASSEGMVIAVEGKWGSGKSSLINLMRKEIERAGDEAVAIVPFAPWLIGGRDQYIFALTDALAKEVEKRVYRCDVPWRAWEEEHARKRAELLREYGAQATDFLGHVARLGSLAIPVLGPVAKALGFTSDVLKNAKSDVTIEKRKRQISEMLKEQKLRFIVLLDDLDRLEPAEAVEVLRLIRSVVDFPNVIYVLCYDRDILAHAIEEGLRVKDGTAYLQKIVQVSFRVPRPESFDLRNWLAEEAVEIYQEEFPQLEISSLKKREEEQDLRSFVDYFGGKMETPREAVMILNSIRFHFPPVKGQVYYPDLVCLHILKVVWPKLYDWLERYIVEWSVVAPRDAQLSEGEAVRFRDELRKLLREETELARGQIFKLRDFIPGIELDFDEELFKVFEQPSKETLQEFDRLKRIGSPDHSRYYFAFANPRLGLNQFEVDSVIELAGRDAESLKERLLEFAGERRSVNGTWFEYLIDRLMRLTHSDWDEEVLCNFIFALSDIADDVSQSNNLRETIGKLDVNDQVVDFVFQILKELRRRNQEKCTKVLTQVISNGKAIVWLLDSFIDSELRRHGKFGHRSEPEAAWNLTAQEVEFGRVEILRRLEGDIDRKRLFETNSLASPLFRWRDFADGDLSPAREWIKEFTKSDDDFVHVMYRLRGKVISSDIGVNYPLRRSYVEPFMDWSFALERLRKIAGDERSPEQQRRRASDMLGNIEEND
ncbi:MAG: P-loop NTPase fold protein [Pseudomonadota bacterium]|nr:P-loop NTPase fold protein [Pseudomonadota bacterium]